MTSNLRLAEARDIVASGTSGKSLPVIEFMDAQQAEIERLRADAERYRWLRKHGFAINDPAHDFGMSAYRFSPTDVPSAVDEAIDHFRGAHETGVKHGQG